MIRQSGDHQGKRAVLYLRVSTPKQVSTDYVSDGLSLTAQRAECEAECARRGLEIVGEYVEPGRSATEMSKRKALQEMLARITSDRDVDVVMVHELSRFFRNRWEEAIICSELKKYGATLMSVNEPIDDSPEGQFMQAVFSGYNELRSRKDGAGISLKMGQKAKLGGTLGMAPLGYLNVIDRFEGRDIRTIGIDPERADHIRWLFAQYATGEWSLRDLAEAVTARGLRTRPTAKRPAKQLTAKTLHQILRNRYYLGEVEYQGVTYPGRHEPLIEAPTFQQVQDVMKAHRVSGERPQKHWHYLTGTVRCARCEEALIFNVITGNGGQYLYFTCASRLNERTCDLPYLPVDEVESVVEDLWERDAIPGDVLDGWIAQLDATRADIIKENRREAKLITTRIADVKAERVKWAEMVMNETVPADIARDKQAELAAQLADLEEMQTSLLNTDTSEHDKITAACAIIRSAAITYANSDNQTRRAYNQTWYKAIYLDETSRRTHVTDARHTAVMTPLYDATSRPRDYDPNDTTNAPRPRDNRPAGSTSRRSPAKRHPSGSRGVSRTRGSNDVVLVPRAGLEPATERL